MGMSAGGITRSVALTILLAKRSALLTIPTGNGPRGQPAGPGPQDFLTVVLTIDGVGMDDLNRLSELLVGAEQAVKAAMKQSLRSIDAADHILVAVRGLFRPDCTVTVAFIDNANPMIRFSAKAAGSAASVSSGG